MMSRNFCITRTTTVICYIANEHKRFHVFVTIQVQLIQDHSELGQWRYVKTKENEADDASRGLDAPTLLRQQRSLEGGSLRISGYSNQYCDLKK